MRQEVVFDGERFLQSRGHIFKGNLCHDVQDHNTAIQQCSDMRKPYQAEAIGRDEGVLIDDRA